MKRSRFDEWYSRSREPKYPDGRKYRYCGCEDYAEYRRVQYLRNAFKAGYRAGKRSGREK